MAPKAYPTQKKNRSYSAAKNKPSKKIRQEVRQAVNRGLPTVVRAQNVERSPGQIVPNKLMQNTINPARSKPEAYPDAQNPFTHVVHHKLVQNVTAGQPSTNFSIVACADPSAMLGIYYDEQPEGSANYEASFTYTSSQSYDSNGASWLQPGKNTLFNYNEGGLPLTTNTIPLTTGNNQFGDAVFQFSSDSGQTISTSRNGAIQIAPISSPYTGTIVANMAMNIYGANAIANDTMAIDTSADGVVFTTASFNTQPETGHMLSSFSITATSICFIRFTFQTSLASSTPNARVCAFCNVALTIGTTSPVALDWTPLQSYADRKSVV